MTMRRRIYNGGAFAAHFLGARWRWRHLRGAALERFHERRARAMVAYAARRAPFYRAHWAGHDLANWRALPAVDKRLMMEHFGDFNTRGVGREPALRVALRAEQERDFRPTLDGLTVGLSSGTSGHRGLFLVSPSEQIAWAATILARTLPRFRRAGYRVAFFLRANSNLYEQVGGRLVQFRYFDLMTPFDEAVATLNAFRPDILVGPPSLLAMLAAARDGGLLQIKPERLISVAEVLEPQDRELLAACFAAPVHQIYQATEGLLAASCAAGSLHIQEDVVALQCEPLPGDPGRATPIVTDLWRLTQPIIRYRLNDILRLDERPCPCGSAFRVIETIEGRCDDICYFEGGAGEVRPVFPDFIRRMVLLGSDRIQDYHAVQEHDGHLRIHLALPEQTPLETVAGDIQRHVEAILGQHGCRIGRLEIVQGLPPTTPGAKRRRVARRKSEL